MIINSDNITALKNYPDNYFDSVVTDPPYGLSFMGKKWDYDVPTIDLWKECFRVLKPGGHLLAFAGTRTQHRMAVRIEDAGFEIRDMIAWVYGSGFPKSHNIGKAIDKIEGNEREDLGKHPTINGTGKKWRKNGSEIEYVKISPNLTKGNSEWEGWGTALKPALEPITVARKPLSEKSVADNVLKWGTGGINIDGCRIGFRDEADYKESTQKNQHQDFGTKPMVNNNTYGDWSMVQPKNYEPEGRFPANIILTHHPECECKGLKKVKGQIDKPTNRTKFEGTWNEGNTGLRNNTNLSKEGYADENGQETIEDWNCHPDCPIKILDEQSGTLNKQGVSKSDNKSGWQNQYVGGNEVKAVERKLYLDTGGASRFFYCAKASKSERNKGLEGFEEKFSPTMGDGIGLKEHNEENATKKANFHPTVKPLKLMQYLVRLVTPPNGIVLDPFCGSGTTGIACKLEGFEFVGMEQDAEYSKIAEARIESTKKDLTLF